MIFELYLGYGSFTHSTKTTNTWIFSKFKHYCYRKIIPILQHDSISTINNKTTVVRASYPLEVYLTQIKSAVFTISKKIGYLSIMQIQATAQIIINGTIEEVFDCSINSQNLPKFFTGYQAIPAIIDATTTDGLPLHPGSIRIVKNSDRSEIEELIINLQRPTIQEYQLIRGFKPPFSWLVTSASGKWLYSTEDSGTQIIWQFEFTMKNYLAYLFFLVAVKNQFQKAQEICLGNIKIFVEKLS